MQIWLFNFLLPNASCSAAGLCAGAEGIPGQGPAGPHPGQGGQLGLGPGLDGRPQRGRETEDGCEDLNTSAAAPSIDLSEPMQPL